MPDYIVYSTHFQGCFISLVSGTSLPSEEIWWWVNAFAQRRTVTFHLSVRTDLGVCLLTSSHAIKFIPHISGGREAQNARHSVSLSLWSYTGQLNCQRCLCQGTNLVQEPPGPTANNTMPSYIQTGANVWSRELGRWGRGCRHSGPGRMVIVVYRWGTWGFPVSKATGLGHGGGCVLSFLAIHIYLNGSRL